MEARAKSGCREALIWLDLEMTGLDPLVDSILQAAVVVTELDLGPELEAVEIDVWQPESRLEAMAPFVRDMHEKNGLLAKVRASRNSLRDAEHALLEVVARRCGPRHGYLAGNSVWQDRRFLARYMPVLEGYLHHRVVDVTSWRVPLCAWDPAFAQEKQSNHTALGDARGSIAELARYRSLLRVLRGSPLEVGGGA